MAASLQRLVTTFRYEDGGPSLDAGSAQRRDLRVVNGRPPGSNGSGRADSGGGTGRRAPSERPGGAPVAPEAAGIQATG